MSPGTVAISSSYRINAVLVHSRFRAYLSWRDQPRTGGACSEHSRTGYMYLGFEHGRVCVATVRISQSPFVIAHVHVGLKIQGLYIFTFGPGLSVRAAFVRPSESASARSYPISCMQLTDRHIYFTWEDERRRQDISLFEDAENTLELPRPITPTLDLEFQAPLFVAQLGGYSFTKSVPLGADSGTLCSFCRKPRLRKIPWVASTLL